MKRRLFKNLSLFNLFAVLALIFAAGALTACNEDSVEDAVDEVEDGAEDLGDGIKDGAEDIGDTIKEGAEEFKDEVDDATTN